MLEGTPPLIAMCGKTTETFKRPSFSVIIKFKRRTPKLCNQKQNPTGYPDTWGLGPKVFETENPPIFVMAAGEEGIVSPHTDSASLLGGCVVSLTPNPGILLHSTERERERERERGL